MTVVAPTRDFERALDEALSDPDFQRTMGMPLGGAYSTTKESL